MVDALLSAWLYSYSKSMNGISVDCIWQNFRVGKLWRLECKMVIHRKTFLVYTVSSYTDVYVYMWLYVYVAMYGSELYIKLFFISVCRTFKQQSTVPWIHWFIIYQQWTRDQWNEGPLSSNINAHIRCHIIMYIYV